MFMGVSKLSRNPALHIEHCDIPLRLRLIGVFYFIRRTSNYVEEIKSQVLYSHPILLFRAVQREVLAHGTQINPNRRGFIQY